MSERLFVHQARQYGKSLLTEAHVQQTVVEFLGFDGWRAIRTDPVSDRSRGKGFGEVGMPDFLFVRYQFTVEQTNARYCGFERHDVEALWIEFKRPGQKPPAHQLAWHHAERKRGALVLVVDDIDRFIAWYKGSGLARRCA